MNTERDIANILLVDDKYENLLALETILKSTDLNIIKASSGNEALAQLLEMEFACILMDVQMPDMDGFELARIIRADDRTKLVPIIFASGYQRTAGDIFKGYETGAVDYLLKPLDPTIVRSKVSVFAELFRKELALKRTEKMLAQYALQLEATNKELESFSYSVSHDLRAPLRSIVGFNSILIEEYRDVLDVKATEYIERVNGSAKRMTELIDGLLDISRVTRKEMKNETVNLSEKAKMLIEEMKFSEPHRQVGFKIEEDVLVQGDSRLLTLVLQNLLSNAWKFSSKCQDATIEFGLLKKQGEPTFFIRDNGEGFNPNYGYKLFGPFQRLHSERDFPGTGVGLATVQRIIRRHGGDVWAEGAVKQGATFFFTLSAAPTESF